MRLNVLELFNRAKDSGKALILNGATGSLLQQRGYAVNDNLWSTNVNEDFPGIVNSIHKEYIKSGAKIITSNTFRTNPTAFMGTTYDFNLNYVKNAVMIAKEAIGNSDILLAGSNPPAEDCYKMNRDLDNEILKMNHHNHIELLIDNSVDFILNETQSHFDEICIICKYCSENKIPYIISLYVTEHLNLLSGEDVFYIVDFISEFSPLAIGFNCIAPATMDKLVKQLNTDLCWGYYLNCGSGIPTDKLIKCGVSPSTYAALVRKYKNYNPSFVGACCGSNPEHIVEIKKVYEQD